MAKPASMGVATADGATAFTRTPWLASSTAIDRVREMRAAFDAAPRARRSRLVEFLIVLAALALVTLFVTRPLWRVNGASAGAAPSGEMVNGKTTAPNEVRGPSIKGGEKKALAAGDVVHIPPRVPHQLLVGAGKEFTYFVIKVVETP